MGTYHGLRNTVMGLCLLLGTACKPEPAQNPDGHQDEPEFVVAESRGDRQPTDPHAAFDGEDDFVVVWSHDTASDSDIYSQAYQDGKASGPAVAINTYTKGIQNNPAVAMNSSGAYVVVWVSQDQDGSGSGIFARRYAEDGSASGEVIRVNNYTTGSQEEPEVAMDEAGNWVAVWQGDGGSGQGIYGQRYTAAGLAAGPAFKINTNAQAQQQYPDVAMDKDGNFVVAWQSSDADGGNAGIYAQAYGPDGSKNGSEVLTSSAGEQPNRPSVALDNDGNGVVVWEAGQSIAAQRLTAGSQPNGPRFVVGVPGSATHPDVAMGGTGGFVVSWNDAKDNAVWAQPFLSSGQPKQAAFQVNAGTKRRQREASIAAADDGSWLVTWQTQANNKIAVVGRLFTDSKP